MNVPISLTDFATAKGIAAAIWSAKEMGNGYCAVGNKRSTMFAMAIAEEIITTAMEGIIGSEESAMLAATKGIATVVGEAIGGIVGRRWQRRKMARLEAGLCWKQLVVQL
ncbi:hypothetical protein B296_00000806 [Ensete ventricosum]|uniref:Uncharacterized protein n=1 Tax=Ensete ventricosum TaxID=4639 RepID=A0A427AL92_ENSVE|nr:hypothetical protein B296_00000806 [Ensete ventricosum]